MKNHQRHVKVIQSEESGIMLWLGDIAVFWRSIAHMYEYSRQGQDRFRNNRAARMKNPDGAKNAGCTPQRCKDVLFGCAYWSWWSAIVSVLQ